MVCRSISAKERSNAFGSPVFVLDCYSRLHQSRLGKERKDTFQLRNVLFSWRLIGRPALQPADRPYNRPVRSHGRPTGHQTGGSGAKAGWTGCLAGQVGAYQGQHWSQPGRCPVRRDGSPGAPAGQPGHRPDAPAPRPVGPGPWPAVQQDRRPGRQLLLLFAVVAAACASRSVWKKKFTGGRHW
jgi:hypothetical protein